MLQQLWDLVTAEEKSTLLTPLEKEKGMFILSEGLMKPVTLKESMHEDMGLDTLSHECLVYDYMNCWSILKFGLLKCILFNPLAEIQCP